MNTPLSGQETSKPKTRGHYLSKLLDRSVVHVLLIVALGILAYSNTFHAPFQWDEYAFIEGNPIVKNLSYFLEPSKAADLEYYNAFTARYVGYLTFALNYRLGGLDVTGYHIFNVTVHLVTSLMVYLLVTLTFSTPHLANSSLAGYRRRIALLAALLFVAHPIQTEAVTYIYQRFASLSAFLYLLTVVLYAKSRLTTGRPLRIALYIMSLLSAVCAMKTKENAFTLPLTIALYEYLFFSGPALRRILRLVPLTLTMLIVPMTYMDFGSQEIGITGQVEMASRGYEGLSREDYLFTQMRVVVTYIRLLFFPVNQNASYDYPLFSTLLDPQVAASIVFFAFVVLLSGYLFYRSREKPSSKLVAFGVYWFFITLSVESSIIPIPMVINEYRVYLPSIGAFAALAVAMFIVWRKIRGKVLRKSMAALMVMIPLLLLWAAYERNGVWTTKEGFWEDISRKSPGKGNIHFNSGLIYLKQGLLEQARREFEAAVRLNPDDQEARKFLGYAERLSETKPSDIPASKQ